jgi:hypothetical protein
MHCFFSPTSDCWSHRDRYRKRHEHFDCPDMAIGRSRAILVTLKQSSDIQLSRNAQSRTIVEDW